MKAYKGFDKNMQCRGFQFKEGETYREDKADLCQCGFHACEMPLDVFKYYPPSSSVYHEVELDDVDDKRESDDSKVCAKEIKVGAKLSVAKLVGLQIDYIKKHTTAEHTDPSAATAGDYGAATAGNSGAATAGYRGAATAGDYGAATAGDSGAATAGDRGAATAGDSGAATAGYRGTATSRGKSATGENGLSVARGNNVCVKGGMGAVLVIANENDDSYDIAEWKAGIVDGNTLKPDTWYKLVDGEFVECDAGGL